MAAACRNMKGSMMKKQADWKSKRRRPQSKNGIAHLLNAVRQTIQAMSLRGKAIIFGGATVVIAAVVIVIVLLSGTPVGTEQTSAAAIPVPTETATATPLVTPTPLPTTPPEPTVDPVLQRGDENDRVMALQNRLMDLGYLSLDESTELYGPATQYAVSLFQRQHGLQQDGIAGQETLRMIYADDAQHYTLLQGTEGDDVDSLQRQLMRLGYLDKATGYYGTETIEAVKAFQERNEGLAVDGKTGEQTLDVIYSPNALPSPDKVQEEYRRANILEMIETAKAQLGKPYVWGAEGPNSFDCSGFVYYCLRAAGSDRGRYNAKGYSEVEEWDKIEGFDDLEIGDLLFFWSSARHKIGHVGIYIGDGNMIDASDRNNAIVIRDCHWSSYKFARRPW